SRQKRTVRVLRSSVACRFPGTGSNVAPGGTAGVGPSNLRHPDGARRQPQIPAGIAFLSRQFPVHPIRVYEHLKNRPLFPTGGVRKFGFARIVALYCAKSILFIYDNNYGERTGSCSGGRHARRFGTARRSCDRVAESRTRTTSGN